jgi:Transposase zinc-ribbon domain
MSGFLAFCDKYSDEQTCIAALADLRWTDGFTCDKCQSTKAYHLEFPPAHLRVRHLRLPAFGNGWDDPP